VRRQIASAERHSRQALSTRRDFNQSKHVEKCLAFPFSVLSSPWQAKIADSGQKGNQFHGAIGSHLSALSIRADSPKLLTWNPFGLPGF
jgi:hypothetical protein